MMSLVHSVLKAQELLKTKFGKTGYQKLVNKLLAQIKNNSTILLFLVTSKEISSEVKLVALACLGESGYFKNKKEEI